MKIALIANGNDTSWQQAISWRKYLSKNTWPTEVFDFDKLSRTWSGNLEKVLSANFLIAIAFLPKDNFEAGLHLVRQLRVSAPHLGIISVSGQFETAAYLKLNTLDLGSNYALDLNCAPELLLATLKNLARQLRRVDLTNTLTIAQEARLTTTEIVILKSLALNNRGFTSKDYLTDLLKSRESLQKLTSLNVHLYNLRKKLAALGITNAVVNNANAGYRINL